MSINTNRWNRLRYTVLAPVYDYIATFGAQRRRSLQLLNPVSGEQILILGAGTGADLPFLPPEVSVSAIDITPAMVERIRERAAGLGRPVDARVMDGHRLDFPDASFDAVILHLIIAVIPDPVACLREVRRVLKPGGRAVVFDKFAPDGVPPSIGRRLANLLTNAVFSDITRQLGPLAAAAGLTIPLREPAAFGGAFQIALLTKS